MDKGVYTLGIAEAKWFDSVEAAFPFSRKTRRANELRTRKARKHFERYLAAHLKNQTLVAAYMLDWGTK